MVVSGGCVTNGGLAGLTTYLPSLWISEGWENAMEKCDERKIRYVTAALIHQWDENENWVESAVKSTVTAVNVICSLHCAGSLGFKWMNRNMAAQTLSNSCSRTSNFSCHILFSLINQSHFFQTNLWYCGRSRRGGAGSRDPSVCCRCRRRKRLLFWSWIPFRSAASSAACPSKKCTPKSIEAPPRLKLEERGVGVGE